MYRHEDYAQVKLDLPFGVTLNDDNRWVQLSRIIPWDEIDQEYCKSFASDDGQIAKSSRLAFGALYIQTAEGFTDEQTRRHIQENPYLQYFCGYESYCLDSPFDASMMTHFRKRISADMIRKINDAVFCRESLEQSDNAEDSTDDEEPEQSPSIATTNRGTLILDATCCPADIHYPTDIGLVNHARELVEQMVDMLYSVAPGSFGVKPRMYRQVARKKYLAYSKKRSHTLRETRLCLRSGLQYLRRDLGYLTALVEQGAPLAALGNELYRDLLVIQEIHRQQWQMFLAKSNRVEDRIVSIDQPHVRPIVRGKAGASVEFGAKVTVGLVGGYAFLEKFDWDNYSESKILKDAVEQYRQRFGVYPKTILADRAYPSRENKLWCKERDIRLSGPRMGRKSVEEKKSETKQIYQDGCKRVGIEGSFGVCKRRYGLERIMTRLPDTSETTITIGFFTANMERKLRLLFAPLSDWALDYDFDLDCFIIFPRNPDIEVIQ